MAEKEKLYLGIEIGGTKIQLAVGNRRGELLEKSRFGVDLSKGADGIRRELSVRVMQLCKRFSLLGICVGFGGPVESKSGKIITSHQVKGWDGFPLKKWLEDLTGLTTLVENDSNCSGWAEFVLGAGRGTKNMVYMNIGSGIGGAVILEKKLYNGQGFGAGEIGHTWVPVPGGGSEKLELFASGWSFQKRLRQGYPMKPGERLTFLCSGNRALIDAKMAARAAREDDLFVIKAFEEEAEVLGIALANAACLFCPEIIVIGGGLSLSGEILFKHLKKVFDKFLIKSFRNRCFVSQAQLGEEVVLCGAILLSAEKEIIV